LNFPSGLHSETEKIEQQNKQNKCFYTHTFYNSIPLFDNYYHIFQIINYYLIIQTNFVYFLKFSKIIKPKGLSAIQIPSVSYPPKSRHPGQLQPRKADKALTITPLCV